MTLVLVVAAMNAKVEGDLWAAVKRHPFMYGTLAMVDAFVSAMIRGAMPW